MGINTLFIVISLFTSDVERIRPNTQTTPGTQEGAGRDVVTPSNRPARSEIPVTPDVERIRPNTRSNTPKNASNEKLLAFIIVLRFLKIPF
ncbi:unnamed protein product [Rhizophagus irregularis]|nr:unnamed protein product [Rhizophagus irregularis]